MRRERVGDMNSLSPSAAKVRAAVAGKGFPFEILAFSESTRTSADAAAAIGCTVAQIAKSIVFRAIDSPVLVMASGVNRVDTAAVEKLLGEKLGKADADFVRAQTGFVIGGVPPVGHIAPLPTFIDADLMQFDEIWAAAGTPFAVFRLTPAALVELTGGTVGEVAEIRR
jgi:prolyl-tRNA editing enzyme YbaK/EbsC (Cys-tRNA(Pro) deacylase)